MLGKNYQNEEASTMEIQPTLETAFAMEKFTSNHILAIKKRTVLLMAYYWGE